MIFDRNRYSYRNRNRLLQSMDPVSRMKKPISIAIAIAIATAIKEFRTAKLSPCYP